MAASGPPVTDEARLEAITQMLLALARQDFSRRLPVTPSLDGLDAVASGINMLAEELSEAVVSRQRLEAANQELLRVQTKLVHAGRLAAIGQLASGVVHEVANPASWSALALELAERGAAEATTLVSERGDPGATISSIAEIAEHIARAREGLARILIVIGDLRTFTRTGGEEMSLVIIDDVVRATQNLVETSLRDHARIARELGEVPPIRGHRGRLAQVVSNLVVNAAQASSRGGQKGNVLIRTFVDVDAVVLEVSDDGPGVAADIRERIFDPFFTTDPAGTGLGLSLTAEIVAQHGGSIVVGTSEAGGARFVVRLPAAKD